MATEFREERESEAEGDAGGGGRRDGIFLMRVKMVGVICGGRRGWDSW